MIEKIKNHYDLLLNMGNDPFYDSDELKEYMDKWDGAVFIEKLCLDKTKTVLEIGVGTGRIAHRTAPLCKELLGIDVSPKTVERCMENLKELDNIKIINADFMAYSFDDSFDVIYSTLTFMHINNKSEAIDKVAALLKNNGRFVLSIDKNRECFIDAGVSKIEIYPDSPEDIYKYLVGSGLDVVEQIETESAYIFVAEKDAKKL